MPRLTERRLSLKNISPDPVEAITEKEASGEIAEFYEDIRSVLGVPVVNLIWRHLATIPGALPWAWESLRPIYESGLLESEANSLRNSLEVSTELRISKPTLTAANLSLTDINSIQLVLKSYERSNALNLIALNTLLVQIDGIEVKKTVIRPAGTDTDIVKGNIPELIPLTAIHAELRELIEDLNQVGGRSDILPSMYRHLAHWPTYLALLHVLLKTFATDGAWNTLIKDTIATSHLKALGIASELVIPSSTLDQESKSKTRDALSHFVEGPLGKMTTIIKLVSGSMPAQRS